MIQSLAEVFDELRLHRAQKGGETGKEKRGQRYGVAGAVIRGGSLARTRFGLPWPSPTNDRRSAEGAGSHPARILIIGCETRSGSRTSNR